MEWWKSKTERNLLKEKCAWSDARKVSIKGNLANLQHPDIIDLMFSTAKKYPDVTGDIEARYKEYAKRCNAEKCVDRHITGLGKSPDKTTVSEVHYLYKLFRHKYNKIIKHTGEPDVRFAKNLNIDATDELKQFLLSHSCFYTYSWLKDGPLYHITNKLHEWLECDHDKMKGDTFMIVALARKAGLYPTIGNSYEIDYSARLSNAREIGYDTIRIPYQAEALQFIRAFKYFHFAIRELKNINRDHVCYFRGKQHAIKIDYTINTKYKNKVRYTITGLSVINVGSIPKECGHSQCSGYRLTQSKLKELCHQMNIQTDVKFVIPDLPKAPTPPDMKKYDLLTGQFNKYMEELKSYQQAMGKYKKKLENWKENL